MTFPEELKNHKQWVCWRWETRKGNRTKPPIMPGGSYARNNDPATWSWFADLGQHDGKVGFVFSANDPYIGVDLDGCRNPETGEIDLWALEIARKLGTYAEVSPSLTGIKLIGLTDRLNPWPHRNKVELPTDKYGKGYGDKTPGIEVYFKERYFCITGNTLAQLSMILNVDDHLDWLADQFGMRKQTQPSAKSEQAKPIADSVSQLYGSCPSVLGESDSVRAAHNAMRKIEVRPDESDGSKRLLSYARQAKRWGLSADQAVTLIRAMFLERPLPEGVTYTAAEITSRYDQANVRPGEAIGQAAPRPQDAPAASPARHTTLHHAATNYLEQLAAGKMMLLETGIPELDYSLGGGVAPGEMMIVAARPSHGKSLIALQMIHHLSQTAQTAIVSEEMSALAVGKRALQFISTVPEEHWRNQSDSVSGHIEEHFAARRDPLLIESCGTIDNVVRECEKAISEHDVSVVAVDYVQLIRGTGNNRYEQTTEVSQALRQLANEHGVLVIALAQLNRNIEQRTKFVPTNADLKETGQLEQDADVIVFGVWPHRIDSSNDPKNYQFYIGKNRNRAVNQPAFEVLIEPSRQRLSETMPQRYPEFDEYSRGS